MAARRDWADVAKGLSIILVVYGHAVVGVHKDVPLEPWLFDTIMKPFSQFRIPLFFFVAGLFAARSVERDWQTFIDRTILHLIYVFIVWNILQYTGRALFSAYANTPIDPIRILLFPVWPINVTWFIWALIVYSTLVRVFRDVPTAFLVAVGGVLAASPILSENYALQQTSRFLVFFVLGYCLSSWTLALDWKPRVGFPLALLSGYITTALLIVHIGLLELPVVSFLLRCFGIASVIVACMWLEGRTIARWLGWLGRYTIAIFVMHTIVTAGVREVLLRTGSTDSAFILIVAATIFGLVIPLATQLTLDRMGFPWLFERPGWCRIGRYDGAPQRSSSSLGASSPGA